MKAKLRANIFLFLTALIWGMGFVAQNRVAQVLQPFSANSSGMLLAAMSLLPIIAVSEKKGLSTPWKQMTSKQKKCLLLGGICCGAVLMAGSVLLQFGVTMGTEPGKAGFISALYIVIVPVIGIFLHKKVNGLLWISVVLCCLGLYFLCIQSEITSLQPGDGLIMISALFYSLHILTIDHFSSRTDCVKLSFLQLAVTGMISLVLAFLTEDYSLPAVAGCILPLLYMGVINSGVAYTLQILAQKDADPTVASLILSLESVFSVVFGFLVLGDVFTGREFLGCVLMMIGILLAQLPKEKINHLLHRSA